MYDVVNLRLQELITAFELLVFVPHDLDAVDDFQKTSLEYLGLSSESQPCEE